MGQVGPVWVGPDWAGRPSLARPSLGRPSLEAIHKGQCIAMPQRMHPFPGQPCEVSVTWSAEVNLPAETHLTAWQDLAATAYLG